MGAAEHIAPYSKGKASGPDALSAHWDKASPEREDLDPMSISQVK